MTGRFAWLKQKRHSTGPVLIGFGLIAQLEVWTGWLGSENDPELLGVASVVFIVGGVALLLAGWWENRPGRRRHPPEA